MRRFLSFPLRIYFALASVLTPLVESLRAAIDTAKGEQLKARQIQQEFNSKCRSLSSGSYSTTDVPSTEESPAADATAAEDEDSQAADATVAEAGASSEPSNESGNNVKDATVSAPGERMPRHPHEVATEPHAGAYNEEGLPLAQQSAHDESGNAAGDVDMCDERRDESSKFGADSADSLMDERSPRREVSEPKHTEDISKVGHSYDGVTCCCVCCLSGDAE